MNKERILQLADIIEKSEVEGLGFNMDNFIEHEYNEEGYPTCGTVACIAGWGAVVFGGVDFRKWARNFGYASDHNCFKLAMQALGLDQDTANELFTPGDHHPYIATPRQAARVLRNLANTGEVQWALAMEEETTP